MFHGSGRPPAWQEKLGASFLRAAGPRLAKVESPSTPAKLLPFEHVSIPRAYGPGELTATWYPAYVAPRGAVLLLHPWLSWGRAYFHRRERLEALRAAGYHALTVDLPGFGGSGRPSGFDDRAIDDALRWLVGRSGGLELFVWGVSAGGYWAHPALTRTDQVAGAMFEDVSPHLLEWAWRRSRSGRAAYLVFRHGLPSAFAFLDIRTHARRLDLGAASYVSGSLDRGISAEDTRNLARNAGGSHSIVQGARHLESIKLATRAVIRTALETFERAAENSSTAVLEPERDEERTPEPLTVPV